MKAKELLDKLLNRQKPKESLFETIDCSQFAIALAKEKEANQVTEYYHLLIKQNLDKFKFNNESECIDYCTMLMNQAKVIVKIKTETHNEMLYNPYKEDRPTRATEQPSETRL